MKKTVVVEILLVAIFAVLLSCAIISLKDISPMNEYIEYFSTLPPEDGNYNIGFIIAANTKIYLQTYLSIGIPSLIAAVIDLSAIIIIAVRDLPIVKQRIDACKVKRANKKESRNAIAKQKRINQLQSELDALKKDE